MKQVNNPGHRFSKEDLFYECAVRGFKIEAIFKPGSDAMSRYGESVIVDIIYSNDEFRLLIDNYRNQIKTEGVILAKLVAPSPKEQNIDKGLIAFDTYDIAKINTGR